MKKIFNSMFIVLLLALSVLGFSACTTKEKIEEIDISASMSTAQDYLLTNVYNKPAGTDFNDEETEEYVPDEYYYITVKSDVADILTSITVNGIRYEDDDSVSLSVGNNNYLVRKAWKLEEESLKIASGLLFSSTNNEGKVLVKYAGKNISLQILDEPTDIEFNVTVEGQGAEITGPVSGVFTYTSNNYAGFMKIGVTDSSDESLLTASSVVAVQKIKRDTNGNLIGITYALSKADLIGDEYYIVYFPDYHAGEEYSAGNPANFILEFKFFVLDIGSESFTFNFVNSAE
jgi:hypothetical protein